MQRQNFLASSEDVPVAMLYQRYAPAILMYIRRHLTVYEDAEDILLEVFVAALESENLLYWQEHEQLAWLRRVAHNKCIDYHRRVSRRSTVVPLSDAVESAYEDEDLAPEQVALRNEEYRRLRAHLTELSDLQQEVLRLRFAGGLRCTEIAEMMHKSDGAIRMLLSRSLNLLRDIYGRQKERS
ncbi:RNA polymerase sigma factor [Ktedonosporobacter rubrisoli]|uniref:RNA polymerase sigma factor n=1 Tax=Ktedonosporobacter rubrisoli TaxID=2509675 RepID=A0A4P6K0G5_KTERU|nr:RNA polymerase sigma factor [Ktedonosporobacter rubrisoli]QBD81539.1 RNA polymerase sigma factor [Ktedonosporobacter rubrisoli]